MFRRDVENWYKFDFASEGRYGVPMLLPERIGECQFIPFNYAKGCREPEGKGVHFFLHDYQFHRLWDMPERYIPMLRRFDCVCTPDYSLYADMPKAMQIYHHYKKQWTGAFWQAHNMVVIPTVSWSDKESYSWCFDGVPHGGVVAVSSVGGLKDKASCGRFMDGYEAMLDRLAPAQVLFYGKVPERIKEPVIELGSFQERFQKMKEGDQWEAGEEAAEKRAHRVV